MTIKFPQRYKILKSYEYVDLVDNTGYVTYYLGISNSSSTFFFTTDNTVYSTNTDYLIAGDLNITTTEAQVGSTQNLDITFNSAVNIKGTLVVSIAAAYYQNGAAVRLWRMKVRPYHYDGSTETSLAAQVTLPYTTTSGAGDQKTVVHTSTFSITQKHFKAGEKLRIKVEFYGYETAETAVLSWVSMGADPKNRTTNLTKGATSGFDESASNEITQSSVRIPFKLEV